MSFTSGVTSTNDQDIDILFGDKTPGAEDLLGGVKPAEDTKDTKDNEDLSKKTQTKKPVKAAATAIQGEPDQEVIDHDADADTLLGGEDKPIDPKALKTDLKKPEAKKPEVKLDAAAEVNYEAIYQDMIDKGLWREMEIPENFEWNKEAFLEMQKVQTTSQVEDFLSRTGPYGKAIIEYENNGGNPSELLNLFRDQKEVQEFDISDIDSQETFLRAYLEAQGNSEKSIERTIKALQDQGPEAFKEEAEEKKAIWDNQYKAEIENRKKEQALYAKQMEEAQKNFQTNIESTLTSDTDVTPKERRELQNYMLSYSQNFQGRQVSQFYVDMAEIQKDPKNYVELAKFIKGLKTGEYAKKIASNVKKEVNANSYLKIKNSTTIKPSGSDTPGLTNPKGSSFLDYINNNKK